MLLATVDARPLRFVSKAATSDVQLSLVTVRHLGKMIISVFVFALLGRFLAKVGPKTPLEGSGSKNGAERT